MSLTVQQLLSDAKRLSSRLRDHDQSADHLISRAQEVLKEVDAMRQYQEDVENLNEVAHNRPRAQLVLGIQQENRHIRTLQQENKELRAALEEHQNALELIMSKYRQHVTRLVNAPHPDCNNINSHKIQMLAERTEKVCEMAAVMKEAVRVDEETCNEQQELVVRLVTENRGLRELLEISQRSLAQAPRLKRTQPTLHKEVQTECDDDREEVHRTVTLPRPGGAARAVGVKAAAAPLSPMSPDIITSTSPTNTGRRSADSQTDSDETGSEDESVKYDTIERAGRRRTVITREEGGGDRQGLLEKKGETTKTPDKKVEEVFLPEKLVKMVKEVKEVEVRQEPAESKEFEDVKEVVSSKEVEAVETKETDDSKEGVVAKLVEELVSGTVDESSPASSREGSVEPEKGAREENNKKEVVVMEEKVMMKEEKEVEVVVKEVEVVVKEVKVVVKETKVDEVSVKEEKEVKVGLMEVKGAVNVGKEQKEQTHIESVKPTSKPSETGEVAPIPKSEIKTETSEVGPLDVDKSKDVSLSLVKDSVKPEPEKVAEEEFTAAPSDTVEPADEASVKSTAELALDKPIEELALKENTEATASIENTEATASKENAEATASKENREEIASKQSTEETAPVKDAAESSKPAANHSRSNSKGKKGKGEKNSPNKKKKPTN